MKSHLTPILAATYNRDSFTPEENASCSEFSVHHVDCATV